MSVELTEASTHEDITKAVDEILNMRSGNASEKDDAAKLAEDNDKPVTDISAETKSGKDEPAPKGDDTGETDWRNDDLKAEVAAYGISETDLADFSSREELDRALRLFDKQALEAGRKAMTEGDAKERDAQGRFVKKEPEAKEEPKPEPPKDGRYEVTLDRDIHDDDLVDEFTKMRDHYESRIAAIEARFAEVETQAEEQQFDGIVDALGHADLFGKSGKESPKELERRQDLFVAVKAQMIGLEQLGRPAELDASLVNRVARMVFADELSKKDIKARTQKISKQSDSRLGGASPRPTEEPEDLRTWARRFHRELEDQGH